MNRSPARWQQVSTLYELVVNQDAATRDAFLSATCAGDEELRSEVESLLRQDAATVLLDRSVWATAAPLLSDGLDGVLGTTLGPYRIECALGSGGMGDVYRAVDTRLNRAVAIKVLPAGVGTDRQMRARFADEARAIAALTHPHICTLYDVGRHDEIDFLVMEYLEGDTLAARLADGQLSWQEALTYAIEIASALQHAHGHGVVHRDLKPANIMLTTGGTKLLDFGLAKFRQAVQAGLQPDVPRAAGTIPSKAGSVSPAQLEGDDAHVTGHGTILGTIRYMAPEQIEGADVDARCDLFSFGAVVFEMLTGRRAFDGDSVVSVRAAILEHEPPRLSALQPLAPPAIDDIVRGCLTKNPTERWQTASDVVRELQHVAESIVRVRTEAPALTGRAAPRQAWRRWGNLIWVAIAAIAVGVAVSVFAFRLWPSAPAPMRSSPLTTLPGQERYPSFSPDGNQIAFAWDGANGDNQDIYVKVVGAAVPLRLTTHPAADQKPVWSSDGRHIAFVRLSEEGGGIYVIPALGGPERKVGSLIPEHEWAAGPSWSPDGRLMALSERHAAQAPLSIFLLSIESLEKRKLTSPPVGSVGDCAPAISPDGRTVAFNRVSAAGGIFLVPVAGGEPTRVTRDQVPFCERLAWTANGRELVFSSSRGAPESSSSLWRVSASGGTPQPVLVGGDNAANPAISSRGHRLAYEQRSQDISIWQIEVPTATQPRRSATKLIASTRVDACPQFSPDGTRIVFCSDRTGSDEIWMCGTAGSNLVQLTSFGGPMAGTPRWSPDGRRIAFDGEWGIHVIGVDGGPSRRVASDTPDGVVPSWSRDGQWIYFASTRTGRSEVWKVPAAGGRAVQITKRGGFAAFESQDGKSLYYAKGMDIDGLWSVAVNGGEEAPVLDFPKGSFWGYWALVETGIYFVNTEARPQPALEFLSFAGRRVVQVATLDRRPVPFLSGLAVSPDERWILYTQEDHRSSDIMLVEHFR